MHFIGLLGNVLEHARIETDNAGGKATTLHKLKRLGYSVPRGFVVLTHSFDQAVGHAAKVVSNFKSRFTNAYTFPDSPECIDFCMEVRTFFGGYSLSREASKILEAHLVDIGQSTSLAIRSSATSEDSTKCSWAGQYKTFLRVPNSFSTVVQAIKGVWASVFSPRVFAYAKHMMIPAQSLRMAVLVQEMVEEPDFSGVLFTRSPSGDTNHMYLEFTEGCGEKLVSGMVTPQSRVLPRELGVASDNDEKPRLKFIRGEFRMCPRY